MAHKAIEKYNAVKNGAPRQYVADQVMEQLREHCKPGQIEGVGKDAPKIVNEQGGKQSYIPMRSI